MGISVPSTQYIIELARPFKVSTDYLLGVDASTTIKAIGLTEEDSISAWDSYPFKISKNQSQ